MGSNKFDSDKEELLIQIDKLIESYDEFSKKISPKHWRLSGSFFTDLKKAKENIVNFSEASDEEKEYIRKYNE